MQANLSSVDRDFFFVNPRQVGEEQVYLVRPIHNGVVWTRENMIFRSSVWDGEGKPVSLSFQKFFNWGERADLVPPPAQLQECELLEKVDGSTLIISYHKGIRINRTRGTTDATQLSNGSEIALLQQAYPAAFDNPVLRSECVSAIFEWVTPSNRIVIGYPKLELYLTGIIRHDDYGLYRQSDLDAIAQEWGVKRPRTYRYADLPEMLAQVKNLKGEEGLCVYFNQGQDILKVKSDWYLVRHAAKEAFAKNSKSVLEEYLLQGGPEYDSFMAVSTGKFDFEIVQIGLPFIKDVYAAREAVEARLAEFRRFVEANKGLSQKEFALETMRVYKPSQETGYVFSLRNRGGVEPKQIKDLYLKHLPQADLPVEDN